MLVNIERICESQGFENELYIDFTFKVVVNLNQELFYRNNAKTPAYELVAFLSI